MAVSTHTINRELFEFSCFKTEHAFQIRDRLGFDLREKLTAIIEKACDEIDRKDSVTVIPTLEIDLGTIEFDNLEEEVLWSFQKKFPERLLEYKRGSANANVILDKNELSLGTLNYFLQNGNLPWFAGKQDENYLALLFEELFYSEEVFLDFILSNLDNNNFIERFVAFISPGHFEKVISWIGLETDSFERIKQIVEDTIAHLISFLKNTFNKSSSDDEKNLDAAKLLAGKELQESLMAHLERIETNEDYQLDRLVLEFIFKLLLEKRVTTSSEQIFLVLEKIVSAKINIDSTLPESIVLEFQNNLAELPGIINTLKIKFHESSVAKNDDRLEELLDTTANSKFYISNSGLILIANYLPVFFDWLGLLSNGNFIDKDSQVKAVFLLYYLCTGKDQLIEYIVPLNKILSGLEVDEPIPQHITISHKEKAECDELLNAVIENWQKIGNITIEGFRESFLDRDGILMYEDNQWILKVEKRGYDVLLDSLPWSFGYTKLGWMQDIIVTEW